MAGTGHRNRWKGARGDGSLYAKPAQGAGLVLSARVYVLPWRFFPTILRSGGV
jgi:hypothetical protein